MTDRTQSIEDREAIDRAERFAKSLDTTPEEHDDIMVAVRLARLASAGDVERFREALESIVREGTKSVTVRTGDAYDEINGYTDYETISPEAEIARAALAAMPAPAIWTAMLEAAI